VTGPSIRFCAVSLLLAATLWAPAPSRADGETEPLAQPEPYLELVETLHAELLGVMEQAVELGYEGRYEKLAPVLKEHFDISFMAQKSVGRHWKSMGEDDRQRLVATFTCFTIANYAGRFDGYSGQHFETLGQEPSIHDTVVVHTRLVDPGDDPVQLDYRLRPVDGGWKIIDVYLNGTVSELALRRSEYSSLIQREGFAALIAALVEKIDDLASTPADQG
jgi:phospholipid transport system substrate-binding protein